MTTSSLAQVAKLVDAGDSKSPAARCVGSSPTLGTKLKKPLDSVKRFFAIYHLQNLLLTQTVNNPSTPRSIKLFFYFFKINLQSIFPFQMLKDERFYLDWTVCLRYLFYSFSQTLCSFPIVWTVWLSPYSLNARTLNRCLAELHYRCCGEADCSYWLETA